MTKKAWIYKKALVVALAALVLVGGGLCLAALSNPDRFSINAQDDKYIGAYAAGGFVCAIVGLGLFLLAASRMTTCLTPEVRRKTNTAIGVGLILQLTGFALIQVLSGQNALGWLLVLASLPLFLIGATYFAQGKGYSRPLGLLGFVSVFGLIVLILLPPKRQTEI